MMRLAILSGVLLALFASAREAQAQTTENQKKVTEALAQEKAKAAAAQKAAAEKTYTFEMSNKPWQEVFEWLTEKTGRPFIAATTPKGSFHYMPPKDKKYTISEIIDIVNEGLAA